MTFDMQKARQAAVELVGRTQLPLPDRLDREQRALGLFPAALDEIERQAKRIAELEGWLVEEEARFQYYVQNENCESWPEARRKYPDLEKKYIGIARQQLISEGKLKPDGTPAQPAKMSPGRTVLTKKQQEALETIRDLVTAETRSDYIDNAVDVLDALLSSPPAWEVTGERKAAISDALDILDGKSDCMRHFVPDVLRSMIEEARP